MTEPAAPTRLAARLPHPELVPPGLIENSRPVGTSRVAIADRTTDRHVELSIRDDGPGVPASDRDRIVEPFLSSRRRSGGTGAGLPIARSLFRAHHGAILLDRNGDQGAAFLVTLPAIPAAPGRTR